METLQTEAKYYVGTAVFVIGGIMDLLKRKSFRGALCSNFRQLPNLWRKASEVRTCGW